MRQGARITVRSDELSRREMEVLKLIAEGFTNFDIAKELAISPETVKCHVRSLTAKLNAKSRTHAVAKALRQSIID